MSQPPHASDLFDYAARFAGSQGFRNTDPDTSQAAALERPIGRSTDRYKALHLLAIYPDGLTDFELSDMMGRSQTSGGKRRGELRDLGLVADTGRRRAAPSGSGAIVWAITARGQELTRKP